MKHWKFWVVISFSVVLVIAFQNCAEDYNSADYISSEENPNGSVEIAPALVTPLSDATVQQNQSAVFTLSLRGSGLVFSWYKDNVLIPGINSNSILLENVQPTAAGIYKVRAENSLGAVESVARLTVLPASGSPTAPPTVITPPANANIFIYVGAGAPATTHTLFISAAGVGLTYQWYFKPANSATESIVTGQTANSLRISPVRTTSAGIYRVVVSNAYGQISAQAVVTVIAEPFENFL